VDLPAAKVRHLVDGEEIAASSGANVLGNPLNSLAWLANHLAGRGRELTAGQWITTGAATGPLPAPAGSTVTGDFGELGTVEVRFPKG
jgi:2-keto-4-pentenoate hydratase